MSKIPQFRPTFPQSYPLKENVVGKAREFLDELDEGMNNSGIYYSLGVMPEKTFIISSVPGTGKTLLVNAINNSRNKKVVEQLNRIPEENEKPLTLDSAGFGMFLFEYDIGKYGTAYINMGSRTIQDFFDKVYHTSYSGKPILVSIDECDALFNSRKSNLQTHSEDRKVLETLMKNLQVAHDILNVYVIMMTNLLESVDTASIRAGRIDRRIKFELPNKLERKLAFDNSIEQVNNRAGYKVIRAFMTEPLAELSDGFNYADIYQSVERSLKDKAKELIRNKEPGIIRAGYVKQKKLEEAVKNHKSEFNDKKVKNIGFI